MHFSTRLTLGKQLGLMSLQDIFLQQLPQLGLPKLIGCQGFALALVAKHKLPFGPITEPIGTVTLVPVKDIGHLLRQLIALSTQRILLDVGQQGLYLVSLGKFRQQAPKPPS